jgi:hypothetical protein
LLAGKGAKHSALLGAGTVRIFCCEFFKVSTRFNLFADGCEIRFFLRLRFVGVFGVEFQQDVAGGNGFRRFERIEVFFVECGGFNDGGFFRCGGFFLDEFPDEHLFAKIGFPFVEIHFVFSQQVP